MNSIRSPHQRRVGFGLTWALVLLAGTLGPGRTESLASPSSPEATALARTASALDRVNFTALDRALRHLAAAFPQEYTQADHYRERLRTFAGRKESVRQALLKGDRAALSEARQMIALQREALLANPLLDFDRLLVIKRKPIGDARRANGDEDNDKSLGRFLGLPQQSSWQLHTMPDTRGWDNEIAVLSSLRSQPVLTPLFRPADQELISEIDLHFDADRLMFSMPDRTGHWQLHEIGADGRGLRQISGDGQTDVHNLDSCYLPDGRIAYISTATFQGVPCNASVNVGMTYLMDADGGNIRQLCFEQDHNFCPTVMNDGRILYLRWEYTDIPHVWARFLFTMNPDGTGQREFYGSGGYWPNAIFYARPIPHHPSKVVGIVTGHHVGRVGELVILNPEAGRKETEGVVQQIPGYGKKIKPLIQDKLTLHSWPKFLHPWPLSEDYFIVACKPGPDDLWGIYLVDTFDNMTLIEECEDYALLEPIPFRPVPRPPVIPDRVDPATDQALVYIEDVYQGPGLKDVPRGEVESLRLFTYHFAYRTVAGINHRVGADGPWEPKRVLGTVPVEPDGSAFFRVPANVPLSFQPLDREGKAVQLMRSWATAMPGEFVSCTGCHENLREAPPNFTRVATKKSPREIEPWYGSERGFSFAREVQPVLDRYCVGCHHAESEAKGVVDLRGDTGNFMVYHNADPRGELVSGMAREELVTRYGGVFEPAYIALRRLVRVGGLESDLRLLPPGEFHADTSELIQMLKKGHHGVQLDHEAWDRLVTWIDLNAPCHGTWTEVVGEQKLSNDCRRRQDLRQRYGGPTENPEIQAAVPRAGSPIIPEPPRKPTGVKKALDDWPFDTAQAQARQVEAGPPTRRVDLGDGIDLELVRIPAGRFVMGDADGALDESPTCVVEIDRPFWMARFEVSNEQYARFDPAHESRFEHKGSWMFNEWDLGWPLDRPRQPVVRVSQQEAMAFCRWLSDRIGKKVSLPTEAQWEYACRAGTGSPFSFGHLNTDFAPFANLADLNIRDLAYDVRDQFPPDLVPRDDRFNDGFLVTAEVGHYRPNAWGLHDMHGNVWEWTRTAYQPYPYRESDGRNEADGEKVVRGGSWRDRPQRARSAFRLAYPAWQKVFNVGFRVVIETDPPILAQQRSP